MASHRQINTVRSVMFRSLRGRLIVLIVLLSAAAVAAGALMIGLFQQSAAAQAGEAQSEIGRACDAIGNAYRLRSAEWQNAAAKPEDAALRHDLATIVETALRDRPGVEGGVWQAGSGSLAYAFPTYQGAGPKTDVPEAELDRIRTANQAALDGGRQVSSRYRAPSQILLLSACPLPGPIQGLTAWTMTRVFTLAGSGYRLLMTGLGVLLAAVLAAGALLARLTMTWSRHVARIETALAAHDIAELPTLAMTGESELDRVVAALNDAGRRLAETRRRADQLARQVAAGERLAAIGRVAAGLAHEVRNPIAAMRLKAENALAGDEGRKREALATILGQIGRLDALLRRLLNMTEREKLNRASVALAPFLGSCLAPHVELARSKAVGFSCVADSQEASFDPDLMRRALDNLIVNAIEAAPAGTTITLAAGRDGRSLTISVRDEGQGPAEEIRDHLFEPFVTGRADGTGLGLAIVREVAAAHGGTARFRTGEQGTIFEIIVPWHAS